MKAFNSLAEAYLYYTECHLATLDLALERKSTSKSEKKRLLNIAEGMIAHVKLIPQEECEKFLKPFSSAAPRVRDILNGVRGIVSDYLKDRVP